MVCKVLFCYYSYGGNWLKFYIIGVLVQSCLLKEEWKKKKKKSEEEIEKEKKKEKRKRKKEEWKGNAIVRR